MRGQGGLSGWNKGPKLPAKLSKELLGSGSGADASGAGHKNRGGLGSRKNQRKAERELKKQTRNATRKKSFLTDGGRIAGKKRPSTDGSPRQEGRERLRRLGPTPAVADLQKRPSSKFVELLPVSDKNRRHSRPENKWPSGDAELALQKELARRLGLKRTKKGTTSLGGDDDGLNDLFQDLGGLDDVLVSGNSSDEDRITGRLPKQKKNVSNNQATWKAEASSDSEYDDDSHSDVGGTSDELFGNNNSEEEEEEASASDDDLGGHHLGGVSEADHEHDDLGFDLLGNNGSGLDDVEDNDLTQDGSEEEEEDQSDDDDQVKRPVRATAAARGKYIPPAARRTQRTAVGAGTGVSQTVDAESEMLTCRRVRGLTNRLAETNLQAIVGELRELYENEGRSVVSRAVSSELVSAAAEGPRASERFAFVAAAAVSGMAALANSSEIVATFLAKVASALETALQRQMEDSLASSNLVQVLAQLYMCNALKPDIIYSLMERWLREFSEIEIAAMATLLSAAGLALRAADPERMRDFVLAVHARAGEVETLSMRARVMLDLVVDIKNNRKRGAMHGGRGATAVPPATAKWLRGLGVDGVAVGGISWDKIVQEDKRGMWWMPTAADAAAARGGDAVLKQLPDVLGGTKAAVAAIGSDAGVSAPELLKLAAAMRMNTDSRRAVFCAVMGSEDAVDALEKLLRLNLKGQQEREVVRVTVDCCLHEASWNPYYAHLLTRLCGTSKGHKMTFQFCLWDHFKEISGMQLRRLTVLARLSAAAVSSGALPLSILKVVDFSDVLSAREVMFWRLFFEHMLYGCRKDEDVPALFERGVTRGTARPLSGLRGSLLAFLKRNVGPWLAMKDPKDPSNGGPERLSLLLRRCRAAERALASTE